LATTAKKKILPPPEKGRGKEKGYADGQLSNWGRRVGGLPRLLRILIFFAFIQGESIISAMRKTTFYPVGAPTLTIRISQQIEVTDEKIDLEVAAMHL
jgi:hypothetical protein